MNKQLDIGTVLSDAFDLYGKHWQVLVTFAAAVSAAGAILSLIIGSLGVAGFILAALLIIPSIIVQALLSGMFTVLIADVRDGVQDKSIGEIFEVVTPKLVPLILTSLLVGLALALGFVLLIIPGIVLLVWFYLSSVVVVLEDEYYANAMRRSKELVSGFFWPALGLGVITMIVAVAAQEIIGGILGSIFSGVVGAFLASTVAGALVQPFTASVPVLAYYQLAGEGTSDAATPPPPATPAAPQPPVTGTPDSTAYTPPPSSAPQAYDPNQPPPTQ